jgi:flavin-dependent dehydrogenase
LTKKFDVAIIGASVAGASTALFLQQHGLTTVVIDAAEFPRRKACGEGLSVMALRELDQLGLKTRILEAPHHPFFGFQFFEKGKRKAPHLLLSESATTPHGVGMRRYLLDDFLVRELSCSGKGETVLGTKPSLEERPDGTFYIRVDGREFQSKRIVMATGATSKVPDSLGIPVRSDKSERYGITVDLAVSSPPGGSHRTVRIYLTSRWQVCCTPVAPDRVKLAFTLEKAPSVRHSARDIGHLVEEVVNELSIDGHIAERPMGVAHIGSRHRPARTRNVFCVGDALRQLDPIGGMGMTQALMSGRITAETIAAELRGESPKAVLSHEVRLRQELKKLEAYTNLTYWSLVSPLGRQMLGRLKTKAIAKEVLLSMHRRPSRYQPLGLISSLLLFSAGRL